jgi:hypothetical protein
MEASATRWAEPRTPGAGQRAAELAGGKLERLAM